MKRRLLDVMDLELYSQVRHQYVIHNAYYRFYKAVPIIKTTPL